jgi:polyhydroxybutyrate depolymerase
LHKLRWEETAMPVTPHIRVRWSTRRARIRSVAGTALAALAALAVAAAPAALPDSSALAAAGSHTAAAGGCGRSVGAGSTTLRLTVDGHQRVVIVHVPSGYSDRRQTALVLNLHGSGSDASQQELFSGMDTTADADDFIVAYPQGLIASGAGFDWNVPNEPLLGGAAVPKNAASDVAFLTALVGQLGSRYCIDRRDVFATGVSGGGRMASQLACDAAGTFAAIAPVAGLRYPSPCPTHTAVPVITFHGTADPIDPFNGGGQAYWGYSVPTAAKRWAAHDHCAGAARVARHAGYTLSTYGGCAQGSSVELYAVTGEGHEWPGGPALPSSITALLGPQSKAVNANNVMWAFFKAHPAR